VKEHWRCSPGTWRESNLPKVFSEGLSEDFAALLAGGFLALKSKEYLTKQKSLQAL
jgi:hypothetical protein